MYEVVTVLPICTPAPTMVKLVHVLNCESRWNSKKLTQRRRNLSHYPMILPVYADAPQDETH